MPTKQTLNSSKRKSLPQMYSMLVSSRKYTGVAPSVLSGHPSGVQLNPDSSQYSSLILNKERNSVQNLPQKMIHSLQTPPYYDTDLRRKESAPIEKRSSVNVG